MTTNANIGAERLHSSSKAAPEKSVRADFTADHSPEAKALLRRYLSEIHGYRQLGNAALSELEERLSALSEAGDASEALNSSKERAPAANLTQTFLEVAPGPEEKSPNLSDRLQELSAYLHADLTKQQSAQPRAYSPGRNAGSAMSSDTPSAPSLSGRSQRPSGGHKPTPNAPVLDRAWFEERFAAMRASIDQLAEQIPVKRLTLLENQFHQLMEKLEARDANPSVIAVEAGLKNLAAYLEDNKQWAVSQDNRMRGVEERLDRLSGLVAQSHAALSATATGLEIVARGTGLPLALKTADIVVEKLQPRIESLDQKGAITRLTGEVGKLSEQSQRLVRSTDERLKHLQTCLDESLERLDEFESANSVRDPDEGWQDRVEKKRTGDTFGRKTLPAARHAASLAEDRQNGFPQDGEPVRYQIPYGEFLPEEEHANSRIGLVIAALILLLASAAMLYLNLREKGSGANVSSAWVSRPLDIGANGAIPQGAPSGGEAEIEDKRLSSSMTEAGGSTQTPMIVSVKSYVVSTKFPAADSPHGELASAAEYANFPANLETTSEVIRSDSVRAAAVAGDSEAQFIIGETLLEGRNVDRTVPVAERVSKAARWFRRAAEKGHAPSQYRLATLYELGQGAPKDHSEAMRWYEQAAERGHVKAMHNLAVLSITAHAPGRPADYTAAANWFVKAAGHGLADSQYNLGILYERGLGLEKDLAAAYHWFALAARLGDNKALLKRDELESRLSSEELAVEKRKLLVWAAEETDQAANGKAPEPPADLSHRPQPAIETKTPDAMLVHASWSAQVTQVDTSVAEAQRLLTLLGYRPGPVDGIPGPRTIAAIRAFEESAGLPRAGQITDALIAKLASALSS